MESNRNLQNLIERAWTLHNNFNNEINKCTSFCRLCSEHGQYCGSAAVPFDEKERLTAIRYLFKEVENRLICLQRLKSWQQEDRQAAITQLEESRLHLLEKVKQHQGRNHGVLNDVKAFLARDEYNSHWKLMDTKTKDVHTNDVSSKRPVTGFLICYLRLLFNPFRWQKAGVIAAKFLAVFASISSIIQIYENRQKLGSPGKNFLLPFGPTGQGQERRSSGQHMSKEYSLNVCYGMG